MFVSAHAISPWQPASSAAVSIMASVAATPKSTISTGSANAPSFGTLFKLSAIMQTRSDAMATIFSLRSAPPPPFIRLRAGSISSAPSMVRSTSAMSLKSAMTMPKSAGETLCRLRCRDAAKVKLFSFYALCEESNEVVRRRACAEPEDHPGLNEFKRARGRLALVILAVAAQAESPPTNMYFISRNSSRP